MKAKDFIPDQPESPPSPTPAELEASLWAEDERKRWEALGNALEEMHILGDYLEKGQHPKEGLDIQLKVEMRMSWKILFKRLRQSINEEIAMILEDLLEADQEIPEEAKEEP